MKLIKWLRHLRHPHTHHPENNIPVLSNDTVANALSKTQESHYSSLETVQATSTRTSEGTIVADPLHISHSTPHSLDNTLELSSPTKIPPDSAVQKTPPMRHKFFSDIEADYSITPTIPHPTTTTNTLEQNNDLLTESISSVGSNLPPFERQNSVLTSSSPENWKKYLADAIAMAKAQGVHEADVKQVIEEIFSQPSEDEPRQRTSSTSEYLIIENALEAGFSIASRSSDNTKTLSTSDAWYERGKQYSSKEQHKEAIPCYENAIEHTQAPEKKSKYYSKIALSHYFLDKIDDTEKYCNLSIKTYSDASQPYQILAALYRQKYETHTKDGNDKEAKRCKKEYTKYLKKYHDKSTAASVNQSQYYLEKALMVMNENKTSDATKYLTKAKGELNKQRASQSEATTKEEKEKNESKLSLLEEITHHASEQRPSKSSFKTKTSFSSSQEIEEEKKSVIKHAVEMFKLPLQSKQLNQYKNEVAEQLKKLNQQLTDLQNNCVKRTEVSYAIKINPQEEKIAKEMEIINKNPLLSEYYNTFLTTISAAYTVAQVESDKNIAIDTNSPTRMVAEQLLSLIPLCGNVVSTITTSVLEFVIETDVRNQAKYLSKIAVTNGDLEKKASQAAREITLIHQKNMEIFSTNSHAIPKGFFAKILTKIEDLHHKAVHALYVEQYNTYAKKLAHEHACLVISEWIRHQKELAKSNVHKDMKEEDIISFITNTVVKAVTVIEASLNVKEASNASQITHYDEVNEADPVIHNKVTLQLSGEFGVSEL